MRRLTTLIAILLAVVAFAPAQAAGKGPGGSKGSGWGGQSNWQQNSGQMRQNFSNYSQPYYAGNKDNRDDSRYRWDNGRWWYWGPGNRWSWWNNGRWTDYGNDYYYTGQPVLENFSGDPIKIVNPAKTGVTLSYSLNGATYSIPPGYSQDLREDRAWTIQFSRGPNMDQAEYGLQPGVYTFARTDHGWELYHGDFPPTPATTSPPTAAPMNPPATPMNPPATPINPPAQ